MMSTRFSEVAVTCKLVFWQRLEVAGSLLLNSRWGAYATFALIYIWPNAFLARHKLLWNDEFFTLYLSRTGSWAALWNAMATGGDQHPPSFYALTSAVLSVGGCSAITLRLSALFGFGLCCICIYEIVRRLTTAAWAYPAMLIPLCTSSLYYATEARGYGIELGFVTSALLMWMLAVDGIRRRVTVPLLAISLCGAVASHYYAGLMLAPLGIAEAIRTRIRRSLDPGVLFALGGAFVPVLVFSPLFAHVREHAVHFWGVPFWESMLLWYSDMIGYAIVLPLCAVVIFLFLRTPSNTLRAVPIPLPFAAATCLLAGLPVLVVIIAKLFTHAFADRYAIAALPGVCILLLLVGRQIIGSETAGPICLSLVCLALYFEQVHILYARELIEYTLTQTAITDLRQHKDTPLVLADLTLFHRISFYCSKELASRAVYLADPQRSVQYLGHDTGDRSILDLLSWFPLNVMRWQQFWASHSSALVYGEASHFAWVPAALQEVGEVQIVSPLLVAVEHSVVTGTTDPLDPPDRPRLYDQIPRTAAPLCMTYLPDETCRTFDNRLTADEKNGGRIRIQGSAQFSR